MHRDPEQLLRGRDRVARRGVQAQEAHHLPGKNKLENLLFFMWTVDTSEKGVANDHKDITIGIRLRLRFFVRNIYLHFSFPIYLG